MAPSRAVPVIADTGGLLRGLASTPEGKATFPEYQKVLISASAIIVPGLVLAEVDYFLRNDRRAMRKLIAEIFDPATRYEYELPLPADIARAHLSLTPNLASSIWGSSMGW